MPATFGRKYGDSQPSFALQSSLASKLRARPEWTGSPEYAVRWKSSVSLLGLQIWRLRASAHHTSEHGSSGSLAASWPTPTSMSPETEEYNRAGDSCNLRKIRLLAPWPTPDAGAFAVGADLETHLKRVAKLKAKKINGNGAGLPLGIVAQLAPWGTPRQSDATKNVRTTEGALREAERKGGANDLGTTAQLSPWPTPRPHTGGPEPEGTTGRRLDTIATLSPWPTPNVPNGGRSIAHAEMKGVTAYHDGKKVQVDLAATAKMAPWASPQARDEKRGSKTLPPRDRGEPLSQQVTPGTSASSSDAETDDCVGSPSLNPAFSLWLMGFPPAWQDSIPGAGDWYRWQDLMALLSNEPSATE